MDRRKVTYSGEKSKCKCLEARLHLRCSRKVKEVNGVGVRISEKTWMQMGSGSTQRASSCRLL